MKISSVAAVGKRPRDQVAYPRAGRRSTVGFVKSMSPNSKPLHTLLKPMSTLAMLVFGGAPLS